MCIYIYPIGFLSLENSNTPMMYQLAFRLCIYLRLIYILYIRTQRILSTDPPSVQEELEGIVTPTKNQQISCPNP